MKTGYECYTLYCALKAHFNSSYDFVKYGGKIKPPKYSTYEKRRDRHFFERLANKNMDYILPFFVANFVANENLWIGDLVINLEGEEIYFAWKKKLSRIFTATSTEMKDLKSFIDTRDLKFDDLFSSKDGQQPIIFRLLTERFISLETYLIIDSILGFSSRLDKLLVNDLIYEKWSMKVKKYKPFVNIDKDRFKKEMISIFS